MMSSSECGASIWRGRSPRSTPETCSSSRWCSRRPATTMCRGRGLIFTMINRSAEPVESCDVLIVGGGPAGSSCAWRLKQAGLDVLVLDKSVFPRDKVCAGWVTPQVTEALQFDLNDYKRRDRTFQPITGF